MLDYLERCDAVEAQNNCKAECYLSEETGLPITNTNMVNVTCLIR